MTLTPKQRRRAEKRERRLRPDHAAAAVRVACDSCGYEQSNGRDDGRCPRCSCRYARYA